MKPKTSLCFIVLNELDGCKKDIPNISFNEFDEIFAVDGGSTDGTVEYLKSKNIKVYNQEKKGLNNAYILANDSSNCDNIVVFFPKNSIDTNIIIELKNKLNQGADIAIASRMIAGSLNEEDGKLLKYRKWSSLMLANLVSLFFRKNGPKVNDILHGVKGWKKNIFNKMKIINKGVSIDLEMVLKGYKLNAKITEIPTKEKSLIGRKNILLSN